MLGEDPTLFSDPSGGGRFGVRRLVSTSVGTVEINAGIAGGPSIARFDDEGWAREQSWTGQRGTDALARAVSGVGVPEDEARRLAAEIEPLVEARRPPTRPAWHQRRNAVTATALYGIPWGVGLAFLATRALRRFHAQR